MSKDTISVTTYAEPETITVSEVPDGGRSAISTVPSWDDKSEILGDLRSGGMRLVRRRFPLTP